MLVGHFLVFSKCWIAALTISSSVSGPPWVMTFEPYCILMGFRISASGRPFSRFLQPVRPAALIADHVSPGKSGISLVESSHVGHLPVSLKCSIAALTISSSVSGPPWVMTFEPYCILVDFRISASVRPFSRFLQPVRPAALIAVHVSPGKSGISLVKSMLVGHFSVFSKCSTAAATITSSLSGTPIIPAPIFKTFTERLSTNDGVSPSTSKFTSSETLPLPPFPKPSPAMIFLILTSNLSSCARSALITWATCLNSELSRKSALSTLSGTTRGTTMVPYFFSVDCLIALPIAWTISTPFFLGSKKMTPSIAGTSMPSVRQRQFEISERVFLDCSARSFSRLERVIEGMLPSTPCAQIARLDKYFGPVSCTDSANL